MLLRECGKLGLGLRIDNAATGNDDWLARSPDGIGEICDLSRIRFGTADAPHLRFEKCLRVVVELCLHILAEGQLNGAAAAGIGHDGQGARQASQEMLGTGDPVEIG